MFTFRALSQRFSSMLHIRSVQHDSNELINDLRSIMRKLAGNNRRRKDLYTLSREDQQLLETLGYKKKLEEVDQAILVNAEFLNKIVANPEIFGHGMEDENVRQDDEGDEDGMALREW